MTIEKQLAAVEKTVRQWIVNRSCEQPCEGCEAEVDDVMTAVQKYGVAVHERECDHCRNGRWLLGAAWYPCPQRARLETPETF